MMAQDKLARECGFGDIVPRMWVGPVQSMSPAGTHYISWDGLWMEQAPGISLDTLTFGRGVDSEGRQKGLPPKVIADYLSNKCAALVPLRAGDYYT